MKRLAQFVVVALVGAGIALVVSMQASATPAASKMPGAPAGFGPRPAVMSPFIAATNAHCGQVLSASLTLNGDLECTTSVGLSIEANNVVLNLNGHRVRGANSGVGIQISGNTDTVENGVVANWSEGVQVEGVTDTSLPKQASIIKVRAEYNRRYGIHDSGFETKITNSTAFDSGSPAAGGYGIVAFGATGGIYSGDRELNNTLDGLYLYATSSTTISGNFATGNLGTGINAFQADAVTLSGNVANHNGTDGIDMSNTNGDIIDGGKNAAVGNDYVSTSPAPRSEQCFGVAC